MHKNVVLNFTNPSMEIWTAREYNVYRTIMRFSPQFGENPTQIKSKCR